MCYMLKPYALRLPTCWSTVLGPTDWRMHQRVCVCVALYCVVLYIAACVDASRTVLWDRSDAWSRGWGVPDPRGVHCSQWGAWWEPPGRLLLRR